MARVQPDPTTVSTVWHSMQTACREMRHIIERTAQAYLIGQLHDFSVGVWAANGDAVALPVGLPSQFLGTGFAVRAVLEKFRGNLRPGDVILSNDPYRGGHNCHVPDWGFFRPIFFRDELLFFTLARAHMQDTGGAFPGGYFPNPYDIHAEGLLIPPTRVIEGGRERTDVLELIWNNVRWPEGVRIDNHAMVAATKACEQRILRLLEKYGRDTVLACMAEMIQRTERAVRDEIRRIPDGTYSGESATDDDGTELDVPVWVRVDITVRGDEMVVDFSRSDGQRRGFVNCPFALTFADAIAAVVLTFDPALADYHNEGTLRPIKVVAPPGSVVHCQYPAPTGASPVNLGTQIIEAVLQALCRARPERAIAAWGKHRGDYTFATDPRTGGSYVWTSFDYDGSAGAVWGHDGYQGVAPLAAVGAVNRGTIEEMEVRVPWRMLRYRFVPDFMGAGRWRGGPGIHWEALNEGGEGKMATGSSDGDEIEGFGALGGHPAPVCRTYLRRGDEKIRVKPHRLVDVKHGDIVVKLSSGGGGVGPPAERDPELVREDVEKGFVSLAVAREVYKVVVDPRTLAIDHEATRALRAAR